MTPSRQKQPAFDLMGARSLARVIRRVCLPGNGIVSPPTPNRALLASRPTAPRSYTSNRDIARMNSSIWSSLGSAAAKARADTTPNLAAPTRCSSNCPKRPQASDGLGTRLSAKQVWRRLVEIRPIQLHVFARNGIAACLSAARSQRRVTQNQSCRPIFVDEMRAGFLEPAETTHEIAAACEDLAQFYEEAWITGIHPSPDTLRASAQSVRIEGGNTAADTLA